MMQQSVIPIKLTVWQTYTSRVITKILGFYQISAKYISTIHLLTGLLSTCCNHSHLETSTNGQAVVILNRYVCNHYKEIKIKPARSQDFKEKLCFASKDLVIRIISLSFIVGLPWAVLIMSTGVQDFVMPIDSQLAGSFWKLKCKWKHSCLQI